MKSENLAWLIRRHGIEMTHLSGGSHIGAIMSVADIIAVLYADILHFDPTNPNRIPVIVSFCPKVMQAPQYMPLLQKTDFLMLMS